MHVTLTGESDKPAQHKLLQSWEELRAAAPRSSWDSWHIELLSTGEVMWVNPATAALVQRIGKGFDVKKTSDTTIKQLTKGQFVKGWTQVPTLSYALALGELA